MIFKIKLFSSTAHCIDVAKNEYLVQTSDHFLCIYITDWINAHLRYMREKYYMGPTEAQYDSYRSAMRILENV